QGQDHRDQRQQRDPEAIHQHRCPVRQITLQERRPRLVVPRGFFAHRKVGVQRSRELSRLVQQRRATVYPGGGAHQQVGQRRVQIPFRQQVGRGRNQGHIARRHLVDEI